MPFKLTDWKKNWKLLPAIFSPIEQRQIRDVIRKIKLKNLVYCSFENRFARSGGLAAVTTRILPYLKESVPIPNVFLLTPFYPHLIDASQLSKIGNQFLVPFGHDRIPCQLMRYDWNYKQPVNGLIHEYYLKADGFFESHNAINDPYIYFDDDPEANDTALRRNALFYCQAVPYALHELKLRENIVLHLQDWQTALLSLTIKQAMMRGDLTSCATVQTMHNAFDSPIPWDELTSIFPETLISRLLPLFDDTPTAFQFGLQLVDGPLSTVSDHFAREFTTDIMQTMHFAPHLQDIFHVNGVFGVNNGKFVDVNKVFANPSQLSLLDLRRIKQIKRQTLLAVLDEYRPPERFGELTWQGSSIKHLPEQIPIFVMGGRLDLIQKGFDIFLKAVANFPTDAIKVILTPMPVHDHDLDFIREMSNQCAGNITVYPIRMQYGFNELQSGSTFGVMPSIYEPFGAAIEYMVNGTVNIARATGGLVDQIVPDKNGLLYRENDGTYTLKAIKHYTAHADKISERLQNPWVINMVRSLSEAMNKAIHIYQNEPERYFGMILEGFRHAQKFNWETSAKKYGQLFRKVTTGFSGRSPIGK